MPAWSLLFILKHCLEKESEYVLERGLRAALGLTGGVLSCAVWITKEILEKVSLDNLEESRESITHKLETLSSTRESVTFQTDSEEVQVSAHEIVDKVKGGVLAVRELLRGQISSRDDDGSGGADGGGTSGSHEPVRVRNEKGKERIDSST